MRVAVRFGRLKPVLMAIGLTPARCYLDVGEESLEVRMSWTFHADVPRSSIRSVHRVENPFPGSFGAHGWRGRWLVNGASGPLVALELEPPVRALVARIPVSVHELVVSVDDPDQVVTMFG